MELKRDFQQKYSVLEGERTTLLKQVKSNLEKGYGSFEGATDHGLKDNYPTSSKVLEALNSKKLKEDLFPKIPGETPISSKVLDALKESGNLKEDTFSSNTEAKPSIIERLIDKSNSSDYSNKKNSIGELKGITESDSDTVSQSSNTKNEKTKKKNRKLEN